jgi:lysyl-tRNA synthetase class 2
VTATTKTQARAAALRALREHLWADGFLEVDTPQLVPGPGLEPHIDPLGVDVHLSLHGAQDGGPPERRYLITSPELALKRVVAQGNPKVFQLSHVWRDGERTPRHSPEFTLLEWYRGPGTLTDMQADTTALVGVVADVVGNASAVDVAAAPAVVSVKDAFAAVGIDLDAAIDAADSAAFVAAAIAAGAVLVGDGHAFDDVFFAVMDQLIEPAMATDRLTFLVRWPASMAVLARVCDDDPRYANRFECYAHSQGRSLELCNAFDELRDPIEQRRRFQDDNRLRRKLGKSELPLDEDFLAALPWLPAPTAGNALGVDRLLMLLLNAKDIDDVLALPFR